MKKVLIIVAITTIAAGTLAALYIKSSKIPKFDPCKAAHA